MRNPFRKQYDPINAVADVTITAADGDKPARIRIEAYADRQEMTVPGFGRVAVALEGMALPDSHPLLVDHENRINAVAGSAQSRVEGGRLIVEGIIARDTEAGKTILALHKSGVRLEASIGALPTAPHKFIKAGDTVDGITATADLRFFSKTKLQEVSLTPIGAAAGTTVDIAASSQGATLMADQITDSENRDLERITAICGDREDIRATAIADDWTVAQTKDAVLEAVRASRPKGPFLNGNRGGQEMTGKLFEAALMLHASGEATAIACYGEDTVEQARPHKRAHIMDYFKDAIHANGGTVGSSATKEEIIRAALRGQSSPGIQAASSFSTFSLPTALGNMQNKSLQNAYQAAPASWDSFVTRTTVENFKEARKLRPIMEDELVPIPGTGEITHTSIDEKTMGVQLETFARMISVDRKSLIDDDTSFLSDMPAGLGRMARRTANRIVWRSILGNLDFDGNTFFSVGNGNLLTGAGSALTLAGIESAVRAMRAQEAEDGEPLDISPAVLVVSDALEFQARQLLESTTLSRDTTLDQQGTSNPIPSLRLEVEPRLSKTEKYTNADPLSWFLFSQPTNAAVYFVTLAGQNGPTINSDDTDFNTLGMQWRIFWDLNAWLGDSKTAVKANGS